MKSVFAFGGSLAAAVLVAALMPACSSDPAAAGLEEGLDPPVTVCDAAKCAPLNQCLPLNGDLKCRKPCSANLDSEAGCPANYVCVAANEPSVVPAGCERVVPVSASKTLCAALSTSSGTRLVGYKCGTAKPKGCIAAEGAGNFCCNDATPEQLAVPVCLKMFHEITPGPKQWGSACNPTKGLDNNPDCDVDQGFGCYGATPADAAAYCTRYECLADRDCPGGFSCATINVGPNVTTPKRTFGETRTACLRRDYCAPCKADLDCPPLAGRTQHCMPDAKGAGFCTPECKESSNCNLEARCIDAQAVDALGKAVKTCYPRAGSCVGDGSLCSPCRNDLDCGEDGACLKGEYTTERFCAKKSAVACTPSKKQCPPSSKPGANVGCAVKDPEAPSPLENYCFGTWAFGDGADLGCWTPDR